MNNSEELNKIRLNVANKMFAGTPKEYRAFEFLISEIDRQHDEFYGHVCHEMRLNDDLQREKIELFDQIAEKDKEILKLIEQIGGTPDETQM